MNVIGKAGKKQYGWRGNQGLVRKRSATFAPRFDGLGSNYGKP